jgi:hypothetical protein
MGGFRDAFLQGRNQARAARGAPSLSSGGEDRPPEVDAVDTGDAWQNPPDRAEPLREHDEELAECKRLIGELKDYAEQLQSRVVELVAGAEVMAKALRLPGVKTFLLQRFHPDKFPDADDKTRAVMDEAIKTINAAYARADELHTSE